jgi:tetratricopeptide (TPR) repeat protein
MANEVAYPCPRCQRSVRLQLTRCPYCKVDLEELALLGEARDIWFNEGLAAARQGRWAEAVQRLSVALAYIPADPGAWVLMGKAYARLSAKDAAKSCFARALALVPGDPRAAAAMTAVGGQVVSPDMLKGL